MLDWHRVWHISQRYLLTFEFQIRPIVSCFFSSQECFKPEQWIVGLSAYQKNGLKKSLCTFNIKDRIDAYNDIKYYVGAPYQSWFTSYMREIDKSLDSSHPTSDSLGLLIWWGFTTKTKANHLSCTEKTQSSSKSLLQGSVIEIFLPVKDMNSQTIKRDQMFPESIPVNILHQRYNKLTPNTNCINIPCIENFKLLCQQNYKEVKTIFSDPSDRQLQKQAWCHLHALQNWI